MTKRKRTDPTDTRWRGDRRYKPPEWVLAARCPVVAMPGAAADPILQPQSRQARKRAANVLVLHEHPIFRERRLQHRRALREGGSFAGPSKSGPREGGGAGDTETDAGVPARFLLAAFNMLGAHLTPDQRARLLAEFLAGAL